MTKILLICQASFDVGIGHFSRLVTLSKVLKNQYIITPEFLVFGDKFDHDMAEDFSFYHYSTEENFFETVKNIININNYDAVVFDLSMQYDFGEFRKLLLELKRIDLRLISIDSLLEYRDLFNLIWIPSFNFDALKYSSNNCIIKSGWDSFLLAKKYEAEMWVPGSKVLILTGGSDIKKLSRLLPDILDASLPSNIQLHWVKGPFSESPRFKKPNRLEWIIHDSPFGLDEIIIDSNYVLTIFGISFFEVLQYGKPCVVYSPYGDKDKKELTELSKENVASVAFDVNDAINKLINLIHNNKESQNLSLNSLKKLTVNGTENLAKEIKNLIRK
jgi:spore coat polysaccharide biosynthesis predicted glycosyltransferase SpsG